MAKRKRFGEILVDAKVLDEHQLDRALGAAVGEVDPVEGAAEEPPQQREEQELQPDVSQEGEILVLTPRGHQRIEHVLERTTQVVPSGIR